MASGLLNRCVELLRREDIRGEIKSALAPVVNLALTKLYPYVQICILLILVTFLLQAGIFVLLVRGHRPASGPQTFSSASI